MFSLGILTISTSGSLGQRVDTSGRVIRDILVEAGYHLRCYEVVSDEQQVIKNRFKKWVDSERLDLIVSTGGTGLGVRDVTPEACLEVVDRLVPGLAEAMRAQTLKNTPMAMLSRSMAGTRGRSLIITLPGSPKAVRECLEVIMPVLPHALDILQGKNEGHPTNP